MGRVLMIGVVLLGLFALVAGGAEVRKVVVKNFDLTVAAEDTSTVQRDTVSETFPLLNTLPALYLYGTFFARDVDTAFADTVLVMQYSGLNGMDASAWAMFDSQMVVLNGNAETTLALAPRVKLDSGAFVNSSHIRVVIVNAKSWTDADTLLVGNDYSFSAGVYYEWRF